MLQNCEYTFYGIDCKQGLELLPWIQLFDGVACDTAEATDVIDTANRLCAQRLRQLKTRGLRMWPEHDRIVLIVDELAECLTLDYALPDKQAKTELKQRTAGLVTLARLGRAAGVYLVAASQSGYVDSVPAALKANMAVRIACKLPTIELLKSALGSSYGYQPEDIPPYPGCALTVGLPDSPTHPRLRDIYDETIKRETVKKVEAGLDRIEKLRDAGNNSDIDTLALDFALRDLRKVSDDPEVLQRIKDISDSLDQGPSPDGTHTTSTMSQQHEKPTPQSNEVTPGYL